MRTMRAINLNGVPTEPELKRPDWSGPACTGCERTCMCDRHYRERVQQAANAAGVPLSMNFIAAYERNAGIESARRKRLEVIARAWNGGFVTLDQATGLFTDGS